MNNKQTIDCDTQVLENMDRELVDIINKAENLKQRMIDCGEFDGHPNKWKAIDRLKRVYRYLLACRRDLQV